MDEPKSNLPTETITLPSKGLIYPAEHPLSKGSIQLKYPTAKEEDILTNKNYLESGIMFDKLLQSLITEKINVQDLVIGDKDTILVAARILAYGEKYTFNALNSITGEYSPITISLTDLKEKELNNDLLKTQGINEFEFELPNTKMLVTYKLLTGKDEKNIKDEIKGLKKIDPQSSYDITTTLKHTITSVNGNREPKVIREFIDTLITKDVRELRKHINKTSPGIKLTIDYDFGKGSEEVPVPINSDFFWPE